MRNRTNITYRIYLLLLFCFVQATGITIYGQDRPRAAARRGQTLKPDSTQLTQRRLPATPDSLTIRTDRLSLKRDSLMTEADSIATENRRKLMEMTTPPTIKEPTTASADSINKAIDPNRWVPNPTKATWLALVIPGGGQIYNRKYWKLPIFYGGFAGCAYALTWNNKMYKDYSSAYKDAVNENWTSTSITDLLPPGYIDRVSKTQLTETLRKRKDTYRRYRDMSVFAFIGVYLLSVVDAYVDAELSNFDISPDLSMRVEPAIIDHRTGGSSRSIGVQCSFRF
ncbi:MAG: DUF5683 domain-containing protein [Mediterranea sp.]|nr:DUF5683 domain-containing protein [Mediterranea sp.]